ncbi:peptidase family M49 protein (macronuclear) [Tetrahymena thermophila SB210]|uniref:Dipeptidyl peptidase 3 n=1 Tax=Tetrahymena thermophila (strain SB210) TaxID=312017 RepID=Q22KE9_TETTS|nr:peptidase family M49 protein [Tetrahymena thermophila SB210]EAR85850.1 peptidase family M49 protein [Tetrahymena thermophila SB210]|eukprot:XP_001033513.1 peptidase family M49 protein [Tetrahymena thermophila SB210]
METEAAPIIPTTTSISPVDCTKAFNELNLKEKLYAYYFSQASWVGSKICYFQRSYESPALFYLFQKIFLNETPEEVKQKLLHNGFDEVQVQQIFVYIGTFFENCGNFKSFGDCKFIPEISKEKFLEFIKLTKAYTIYQPQFDFVWENTNYELYAYHNPYQIIEFINNQGHTSYYSSNISQQNAEQISKFMEQKDINLSPLNTRLLKHSETEYEILVASITKDLQPEKDYEFEGLKIKITYGDFKPFLASLNGYLEKCIKHAENDHQVEMIKSYLKHFENGSIDEHKNSQRHWIKDKGPIIETNIGFIESYLDPLKVRAEFEGFVSVVNKEESKKLEELVSKAEGIISHLPWPKEFEVEKFTKPDFTSLEVLTFASSGIPIGINIPNYDDIRQTEGFKNVNLGNVYSTPKKENVLFANEATAELYCKYFKDSLFVIVALHELLGHGTGKLFQKKEDDTLNFDQEHLLHPILNTKIDTYYDKNETWHSKFGDISSSYEECRADSVAIYLSCFQESLDILIPEYSKEEQSDLVYIAWYEIVVSSIKGLEYYNPELKKWGQAHTAAAYAITKVLIEAGQGLVTIEKTEKEGKPYVYIHLDKSKIWTVGKEAMRKFLIGLQVYKSTGDSVRGIEFFNKYLAVDDEMLEYRKIALDNKKPRKLSLQSHVKLVGNEENVELVNFESTFEGLIKSFTHHYEGQVDDVYTEWLKYHNEFRIKHNK